MNEGNWVPLVPKRKPGPHKDTGLLRNSLDDVFRQDLFLRRLLSDPLLVREPPFVILSDFTRHEMTQADWLSSTNPAAMLASLRGDVGPYAGVFPISDRKLRLWVEACRAALVASEKAHTIWVSLDVPGELEACVETWSGAGPEPDRYVSRLPMSARAALLREIRGNPWRPVKLPMRRDCVPIGPWEIEPGYVVDQGFGPEYCPWLTPQVVGTAQAAYDERLDDGRLDPHLLAILADALVDAGCDNTEILNHLRGKEPCWNLPYDPDDATFHADHCGICDGGGLIPLRCPHVRGCWAIDPILGKE